MKISLRKRNRQQFNNLRRRLLPLYMKPTVFIAFIVISLVGQFTWVIAVYKSRVDPRWCSIGFALGIILGYIHGRWTARMWNRDYLRVLNREISFWQAKGATGTTIYVILALGIPIVWSLLVKQSHDLLAGLQSYIFGFVGGMNLALYLWVRRLPP